MPIEKQTLHELQALLDPVMLYLKNNFHPHIYIQIDSERAEILEGQASLIRKLLHPDDLPPNVNKTP